MVVAISGASGFVGTYLQDFFYERDVTVLPISRSELSNPEVLGETTSRADVIINLSGANIIHRWSKAYKKKLYKSRVETTKAIVAAMNANEKEQLLISTSAIGIYENNILVDEEDYIFGDTFLSKLCQDWEREAGKVTKRLAIFRLGVIMGQGGALQKMLPPFKLGLGGVIGDGSQAFSYIHIEDLARAYEHLMQNPELDGVFNLTTPYPTTNKAYSKALAKALHRPAFIPVPRLILKIIFGEGAQVLMDGQRVYPKRLLESGFTFKYENVETVLEDLVG